MAEAAILGISPGTKYVGIAVLSQGELLESKVASFKGGWSQAKKEKISSHITSVVKKHKVVHVACKIHHASRTSCCVDSILESIKEIAADLELEYYTYTIEELKGLFKMHFQNKHVLSEHLTRRFPELLDIFYQERRNKNKYHYKMFEALAACLYCQTCLPPDIL